MFWYCEECSKLVVIAAWQKPEEVPCIKSHKNKIVGIRPDIMAEELKRIVWTLKRTDRLVRWGEG